MKQDHSHTKKESKEHSHNHAHSHNPKNFGKAFLIAIALNSIFIVIEVFYGLLSHSTALLSDATHNFGDVLGLLIAWFAYNLSSKNPTSKFTYGFKSSTILATAINGMFLLVATGAIAWEAVSRIFNPSPVNGVTVIIVATIGIIINSLSAYLLSKGGKDINIKGAFLHLMADALVSVGVVVAGIVIVFTNFLYIDPIVSIVISIVIFYSTWGLFKEGVKLALHAVPSGMDLGKVKEFLLSQDNIKEVHDLHIWAMGTTETALTAHLVLKDEKIRINTNQICQDLHHEFEISHSTLQVENMLDKENCKLEPDTVI
jgi:cobalt-zinc-cadmium efflux system protein